MDEIVCMDCVEGMRALDDRSVDMVITSPPYDNLRTYNGFTLDVDAVSKECFRVLKDGGVMVWIVADAVIDGSESCTSFRHALCHVDNGFKLHDTMIWEKDTCSFPDRTRYRNCFEYMFVFSKGRPTKFHPICDRPNKYAGSRVHGTYRKADGERVKRDYNTEISEYGMRFNVWRCPTEKQNRSNHPAPFPVQLIKDHIESWSDEGDTVLDPFMGSGTTALACVETGRHYIGFDVSEEYCQIARNRVAQRRL